MDVCKLSPWRILFVDEGQNSAGPEIRYRIVPNPTVRKENDVVLTARELLLSNTGPPSTQAG